LPILTITSCLEANWLCCCFSLCWKYCKSLGY